MLVFLTSQHNKSYPPKMITWHSLVEPSTQMPKNAIGPQHGCMPSERKPCYRRFGVDRHTCWESGIAVEKLRRIWKFWFYLSLCDNAMGSKHKLNNQHMHFHSLVHTLAGLNENQHPRAQFQYLFHLIWCWRPFQCPKNRGKSTKHPQNDLLTDTQPGEEAHRSPQYHHGSEISKVV